MIVALLPFFLFLTTQRRKGGKIRNTHIYHSIRCWFFGFSHLWPSWGTGLTSKSVGSHDRDLLPIYLVHFQVKFKYGISSIYKSNRSTLYKTMTMNRDRWCITQREDPIAYKFIQFVRHRYLRMGPCAIPRHQASWECIWKAHGTKHLSPSHGWFLKNHPDRRSKARFDLTIAVWIISSHVLAILLEYFFSYRWNSFQWRTNERLTQKWT